MADIDYTKVELTRDNCERVSDEVTRLLRADMERAQDRGRLWGPEDSARFARKNRKLVRAWMDLKDRFGG